MSRQRKTSVTAKILALGASTAISAISVQAMAADGFSLEEIVVTASKRSESLQKVPISVAALKGEDLEALGVYSLNDYYKFIPGINYAPSVFDRGGPNIIVRGVTNTRLSGVDAAASSATTSFYLNDIPVTLIDPQLFDINRVEVLKGPQGTLFGAASMGGTVRIIMNKADTTEWAARVEGTVQAISGGIGNRISGMINVPLVQDVLAARVVAYHAYDPGYIDRVRPALTDTSITFSPDLPLDVADAQESTNIENNVNTKRSDGARLALTFTPNDKLTLEPTILYQRTKAAETDQFDASLGAGLIKSRFIDEPSSQTFFMASLEGSYDMGAVELYSATGYFERNYKETSDQTRGTAQIFGYTADGAIPAAGGLGAAIKTESFTQEIRLQSTGNSGNDFMDRFDWVIGAYYSHEKRRGEQLWQNLGFNANAAMPIVTIDDVIFASVWDTVDENKSVFGDVSFHVTEKLKLSAGLRYYDQSQETARDLMGPLQGAAFALTPQETFVSASSTGTTPRFTASFQATDDILVYASAAKGFRAGGGVIPSTEPNCVDVIADNNLESFNNSFGPDKLWQYEGGFKSTMADGRLQLNGAAYLIKWTKLQQGILLSLIPGSTCTKVLTGNVGAAEIKGLEAEFKALPMENLMIQGSVSYSRARISEVDPLAPVGSVGDSLQNVPDWNAAASIQYSFPDLIDGSEGYVRADYAYRGSLTTTIGEPANPLQRLGSYSNVNFRAGVNWNDIKVEAFINNAFNTYQLMNAGSSSGGIVTQQTNTPRTVGLTVGKKF